MGYLRFVFSLLFLLFVQTAFASKGESTRILIHTLNYLGQDYKHSVKDGKIVSADEYEEQLEFCESASKYFKEFSTDWSDKDSAEIGALVYELIDMIHNKADATEVAKKAAEARTRVLTVSGLKIYPLKYPNITSGKKLFIVECAKCHGADGYGNGPEGKDLNPQPRNFHDNERMNEIAPSHIFNTIRLGVQGTGMKAHLTLEDEEVWNLAFYVLTLRYPDADKVKADESLQKIPLEKIVSSSDEALKNEFALSNEQVGSLRLMQPKATTDKFIKTAVGYLEQAHDLYTNAKQKNAIKAASLAYLEGIEPIEMQLRATDPALSDKLERQFQQIRKMMKDNRPVEEVSDSIEVAQTTLIEVSTLLEKKEYSFWLAFVMSISILLREGLEAFLVVLVILSVLKAGNITKGAGWVHAGWISAIIAGLILWVISDKLIAAGMGNIELIEGFISLLAVAMLLYIGFWLHSKSEIGKWKAYVSQLVKGAVSNGSLYGLATLSFFVVFREVFESVLFLGALNIESGGKQGQAIALGVGLAFILVVIFALVVLRFSAKLPIPKLFKISSVVMGLLAVVLVGKGIHSLQEINYMPVHGIPLFRVIQLGIYPTLETTLAQVFILLLVVVIYKGKLGKAIAPEAA